MPSTAWTAATCRWSSPLRIGKCLTRPCTDTSSGAPARGPSVVRVAPGRASGGCWLIVGSLSRRSRAGSQLRLDLVAPDLSPLLAGHVAGHEVIACGLDQLRPFGLAQAVVALGECAARVEGTALRHVDQAGWRPLDRQEALGADPVEPWHRAQQPPGV